MHISTQMMYQQNMRGITNSQAEWVKLGEWVSMGKRVINPSDDPIAASQAVVLSQAQAQNSQYTLARSLVTQKVSLEEDVSSQVMTATQAAQGKVAYAGNGALNDDDRTSLTTDLQKTHDQLMNLANSTDDNGRYILGGYKTESAPSAQADGTYSGDTTNIIQQIDTSRTMVISHTGDKVFTSLTGNAVLKPGDGTQEKNLFRMPDTVIGAPKAPIASDNVTKATAVAVIDKINRGLRNSLSNVLSIHTELDTQLSELSSPDSLDAGCVLDQIQQTSNLADADWNAVISSYAM